MNIIDISWPISPQITEYKNKNSIAYTHLKTVEADGVAESSITYNVHTGTHIDAPAHFIVGGATVDQVSLQSCIGECIVLDFSDVETCITHQDLEKYTLDEGIIVLLKTKNSLLAPTAPFNPEFVYLDHSGALYLASRKVKAVGIDYLGIERNQPDHATHIELMNHHITIIEGLRLEHATQRRYTLYCLPLALTGLEAATARAILLA